MRPFGYKFPDYFMEYGPVFAEDLEGAKAMIRRKLDIRRLPSGIQIWDLTLRPLKKWRISPAATGECCHCH